MFYALKNGIKVFLKNTREETCVNIDYMTCTERWDKMVRTTMYDSSFNSGDERLQVLLTF